MAWIALVKMWVITWLSSRAPRATKGNLTGELQLALDPGCFKGLREPPDDLADHRVSVAMRPVHFYFLTVDVQQPIRRPKQDCT